MPGHVTTPARNDHARARQLPPRAAVSCFAPTSRTTQSGCSRRAARARRRSRRAGAWQVPPLRRSTVHGQRYAPRGADIDTQLLDFDWSAAVSNLIHVAVAYLIALPIGWDRERSGRGVGLRTFPLVAVASCGYLLIARDIALGNPDAQSRVLQGLLGGIGFIGGGAILKEGGTVRGTATAASIWNTAAIGVAVAFNRFEIAVVLGAINFLTLRYLNPLKQAAKDGAGGSLPSPGAVRIGDADT